jgi:hypothetical protein
MFIFKLCEPGDLFIYDSEDGELLWCPSGKDTALNHRCGARQAGYSILVSDPSKIIETLFQKKFDEPDYIVRTWIEQIIYVVTDVWKGRNPLSGKEYENGHMWPVDDKPVVLNRQWCFNK